MNRLIKITLAALLVIFSACEKPVPTPDAEKPELPDTPPDISDTEKPDDPNTPSKKTNFIKCFDENKPVRAAFFLDYGELIYFCITPGKVEYFEEVYDATSFLFFSVPTVNLGKDIKLPTENTLQYYNFFSVPNGTVAAEKATGSYILTLNEDGTYTTEGSIIFDEGYPVSFYYSGEAKDGTIEKPVDTSSFFKYGEQEYTLKTILVEDHGTVCTIYGCQEADIASVAAIVGEYFVVENFPTEYLNDEYGAPFSFCKDVKVTFKDKTWQYPDTGNVTMMAEKGIFTVKFTENFEAQYYGPITIL